MVGPAGTGDAGNFRRRRRTQQEEEREEERVAAMAIAGPWRPAHPVALPNSKNVDDAEAAKAAEARAALVEGLVGAWDPDRRDGAGELQLHLQQLQQQRDSAGAGDVNGGIMSSPSETRAHLLAEAEAAGLPEGGEEELALEIEEQEGKGEGMLPASEAAAARDGWFGDYPFPGEEADPGAQEDGAMARVKKDQEQQGGEPKVAATAIAGPWKPQHVVPPPHSSVGADGTVEVRGGGL